MIEAESAPATAEGGRNHLDSSEADDIGHTGRRRPLVRWWANLPVRYKGLLVIAVPVFTLVLTALFRIPFTQQQQETTALLSRSADTRDTAHELLISILDAETGTHGYALTGDERYLASYERGRQVLSQTLVRLQRLVDPGEERHVFDRVAALASGRLDIVTEIVSRLRAGAPADDPEITSRLGEGREKMEELRTTLNQLIDRKHAVVLESQQQLRQIRERLAPIVYITFLGGFAGALVAMWLFVTGIGDRLAGLERNAERLAQGLSLRHESSRGSDEIGSLDRALRRASIMLRARDRELRLLNETLERNVHEQELLNRELEAFSYSVSHDLRAPLRSIDGFAQALREDWGDRLDEIGQDHLSRVRNAAQRMGRLIDDLLKLSRLTRAQIQRVDVDLSHIAREIIEELSARNPTRQVTWDVADNLYAKCDASLARIVLENLLGNAWKFTSKTSEAEIAFHALPETRPTMFVVRDNGAGFDMKYADKLFAPFQRLHGEREFPGTGIGLATVQRIVHKHGGEVRTRAEPGRGASFYFTLEPQDGVAAA